jgi:hypothetical protein
MEPFMEVLRYGATGLPTRDGDRLADGVARLVEDLRQRAGMS